MTVEDDELDEDRLPSLDERASKVEAKIKNISGRVMHICLLYTSPSPRDVEESRMPSSA